MRRHFSFEESVSDLRSEERSRPGRLPHRFLCVAILTLLVYTFLSASITVSLALQTGIRSASLLPNPPLVETIDNSIHPLGTASPPSVDTGRTLVVSAQKASRSTVERDATADTNAPANGEPQSNSSFDVFTASTDYAQAAHGGTDVVANHRLAENTIAHNTATATNSVHFAEDVVAARQRLGHRPAEIELRLQLQETQRLQPNVRQRLKGPLPARSGDLRALPARPLDVVQQHHRHIVPDVTSQPPENLPSPENGGKFVGLLVLTDPEGSKKHEAQAKTDSSSRIRLVTEASVRKRIEKLQQLRNDLYAEENELTKQLEELLSNKAQQTLQNQTQERSARSFNNRFEAQHFEDTLSTTGKPQTALRRRRPRRRHRRRRLSQPAYLQLAGDDERRTGGGAIADTHNNPDFAEDDADTKEKRHSGEDQRESREDGKTQAHASIITKNMDHAEPVIPPYAGSAASRGAVENPVTAADVAHPEQPAVFVRARPDAYQSALLEGLSSATATVSVEGLRRRRGQAFSKKKSPTKSSGRSQKKSKTNDYTPEGSTFRSSRQTKRTPEEAKKNLLQRKPASVAQGPTDQSRALTTDLQARPSSTKVSANGKQRTLRTEIRESPTRRRRRKGRKSNTQPDKSRKSHQYGKLEPTVAAKEYAQKETLSSAEKPRKKRDRPGQGSKKARRRRRAQAAKLKESAAAVSEKAPVKPASEKPLQARPILWLGSGAKRLGKAARAAALHISPKVREAALKYANAAAAPALRHMIGRLNGRGSVSSEGKDTVKGDEEDEEWDRVLLDERANGEETLNEVADGELEESTREVNSTVGNSPDDGSVDEEDNRKLEETEEEEFAMEQEEGNDSGDYWDNELSAVQMTARQFPFDLQVRGNVHATDHHQGHGWYEPENSAEGDPWQTSELPDGYAGGESDSAWSDVGEGEDAEEEGEELSVNSGGGYGDEELPSAGGGDVSSATPDEDANSTRAPASAYMEPKIHKFRKFEDFGKFDRTMGRPDWIKQASTSANAPDVDWGTREKLQIHSDEDVYRHAHDTVPGLDFLGIGYDMLKGNPLGDPETSVDPGFRDPVLRFYWTHSTYGVTNALDLLQPVGGYVRPFVSCRRSEAAEELSSMSDYAKELSVDAKVEVSAPFVAFSAGTSYKEMAKTIAKKEEKTYLLKTYCFRYEAGISSAPNINWNTTYGFESALLDLPTYFYGMDRGSNCQPSIYKTTPTSDACEEEGVTQWMKLFQQYGTHVTTNVKLGGKIIHSITMKKSSLDTLKDKGIAVSAAVAAKTLFVSGGVSVSTSTSNSSREANASDDRKVSTYIIGGRPPKDVTDPSAIVLWSKTVEELPMPIQIRLQPLSLYMPHDFRFAYEKALAYYGRAFGTSQAELDQIFNEQAATFAEKMREGHSLVWGGTAPGYVECPGEELVVLGFAVAFNFRDLDAQAADYHMSHCEAGRRRCDGPPSPGLPGDEVRIWAVCAPTEIVSMRQLVVEGGEEKVDEALALQCPNGMQLAIGLKLVAGYGPGGALESYIEHCVIGESYCEMGPRPSSRRDRSRRFLYAVCLESTYPGIQSMTAVSSVGDVGYAKNEKPNEDGSVVVNCGHGQVFLLGWTLENHTRAEEVRNKFANCTPGKQLCLMKGAGINRAPLVGGQVRFQDTHALLGFGVCVLVSSHNSHPEAHSTPIKASK